MSTLILCCSVGTVSRCGEQERLSSCGMQPSCGGFSRQSTGPRARRLNSCAWAWLPCGIFWTKDWPSVPCIARQILNHRPPGKTLFFQILGWPKISIRFFCKMLQKNANELFGQHSIWCWSYRISILWGFLLYLDLQGDLRDVSFCDVKPDHKVQIFPAWFICYKFSYPLFITYRMGSAATDMTD